ncbi:MAG: RebB family R body protein [Rhodospirillales bacterium]|nr:RebB family R body protein [Rhodospirillales bacterium]
MAIPTPVNGMITDAVTQSSVAVLGSAPAQAMGNVYQAAAHSLSVLFQNSVQAQQHAAISAQAATNQGVMQLYSVPPMASAMSTAKIAQSNEPDFMMALLMALAASKK